MKAPNYPTAPYPPYLSFPEPQKTLTKLVFLKDIGIDIYGSMSLDEAINQLSALKEENPGKEITISYQDDSYDSYYDEVVHNYSLRISYYEEVENKEYNKQLKRYNEAKIVYDEKMEQYQLDLKEHKKKLIQYRKDMEAWQIFLAEETLRKAKEKAEKQQAKKVAKKKVK